MAEKYITKTHKTKTGEIKSIKYRVDAAFEPAAINDITIDFIENWCNANDRIDWLVEEVNKPFTITNKQGKVVKRDYPFVSIRADFVNEFFPEIVKGSKKPETLKQRINKKYKKK